MRSLGTHRPLFLLLSTRSLHIHCVRSRFLLICDKQGLGCESFVAPPPCALRAPPCMFAPIFALRPHARRFISPNRTSKNCSSCFSVKKKPIVCLCMRRSSSFRPQKMCSFVKRASLQSHGLSPLVRAGNSLSAQFIHGMKSSPGYLAKRAQRTP